MTQLSVAIIGTGNIAGGYDQNKLPGDKGVYSHAGAYAANGMFALKTVFDTDPQRADAFCKYWKAESAARRIDDIYENFHDVVSVCTPDETHFDIVRTLVERRCCKTVFVEKPAAAGAEKTEQLDRLARAAGINVVVNFQRRHEASHLRLREEIAADRGKLLAVNGYYIKGLHHIGVTAVDTLTFLLGLPEAVLTYNRVLNQELGEYTYEFILFFDHFNATVKTVDTERHRYNYHIFEIDLLFADRRATFMDNSRLLRHAQRGEYAYSGVTVLNDRAPSHEDTGMAQSMPAAAKYIFAVTSGEIAHTCNTLAESHNNALIIDRIEESFRQDSSKLYFEPSKWKK